MRHLIAAFDRLMIPLIDHVSSRSSFGVPKSVWRQERLKLSVKALHKEGALQEILKIFLNFHRSSGFFLGGTRIELLDKVSFLESAPLGHHQPTINHHLITGCFIRQLNDFLTTKPLRSIHLTRWTNFGPQSFIYTARFTVLHGLYERLWRGVDWPPAVDRTSNWVAQSFFGLFLQN